MAVFTPRVPVFCIVRARWYSTVDVFDGRDWLVKAFEPWFVAATGPATVPLVGTGPKPPAEGGHVAPVPDPRMDQVLARLAALETTAPGSGGPTVDPRVDGLAEKVEALETKTANVEASARTAGEKADQATVKAAQAEAKAVEAAGKTVETAATVAQVKAVTDVLKPLKLNESYAQVKANAEQAVNDAAAAASKATAVEGKIGPVKQVTDRLSQLNVAGTYAKVKQDAERALNEAGQAKSKADQASSAATEAGKKASTANSTASTANLSANTAVRQINEYMGKATPAQLGETLKKLEDGLTFRETATKQLSSNITVNNDELNGLCVVSANPSSTLWLWDTGIHDADQPGLTINHGESALILGDSENACAINLIDGKTTIFVEGFTVTTSDGGSGTLWVSRPSTKANV